MTPNIGASACGPGPRRVYAAGSMAQILAVPPLYPPGSRVGAWLATHSMLIGLAERGHDVRVIPFLARRAPAYGIDGICVEPGRSIRSAAAEADVVIAHAGAGGARDPLLALGWERTKTPIVRIVHGLPCNPSRLADASLVIANSATTAGAFALWHGAPIVVSRPPTDPAAFETEPGDRVTLVNLAAAKGGSTFWAAARACPEIPFLGVLGGYGDQLIHRPIPPNVELVGPLQAMREEVYARTRLLLMPSRFETWGMAGIEAMCSGIPVLARPCAGLAESLGSAANFCEGEGPLAWAEAIRALLEPEAWAEASARAKARVAELDPAGERARFVEAVEGLLR